MLLEVPELDYKLHEIVYNFHVNVLKLTPPDLRGLVLSGTPREKHQEAFNELQQVDLEHYQACQRFMVALETTDLSLTADIQANRDELEDENLSEYEKERLEATISHSLGMKGVILKHKEQVEGYLGRISKAKDEALTEILRINTRYANILAEIEERKNGKETENESPQS